MTPAAIVLLIIGFVLIIAGFLRTRAPYAQLRALQAKDQNVARYNAWRGGVRDDSKAGASVAMAILQRQVKVGAGIGLLGIAAVFVGLLIR